MASELTEYELRRLENIKRNEQMMSSLKIHARLSEFKEEKKKRITYADEKKKTNKPETLIATRRSLRARGMPPHSKDSNYTPVLKKAKIQSSLPMSDAYHGQRDGRADCLIQKLTASTSELDSDGRRRSSRVPTSSIVNSINLEDPIDVSSFGLQPQNIARVVPGRIMSMRFFPTTNFTMIVAGNKYGNLAFWDLKAQTDTEPGNGIYFYQPHSAPISGISMHPFSLSKMYTSCYDGILRLMDIEKEMFNLVFSSNSESALFSLSQQPDNGNNIYFGEGQGGLTMFDGRVGKFSCSWSLHEGRINSIDFNPTDTNLMATSSTDRLACIWDLRKMEVKQPSKSKALRTLNHARAVQAAYFSPSGSCLATTSLDDKIGVLHGPNFEDMFMIPHDNKTNRWLSSFRAVWGWDDTHLYVGNMKRRVDVVSLSERKTVYAMESPLMSAIPCRFHAHPYVPGLLAGATSGGQVYVWTTSAS